jgi:hypothetical protein
VLPVVVLYGSVPYSAAICKLYVKILLCLYVKYGFHCIDFHNTHSSSVALPGDMVYRISLKSVKKYGM